MLLILQVRRVMRYLAVRTGRTPNRNGEQRIGRTYGATAPVLDPTGNPLILRADSTSRWSFCGRQPYATDRAADVYAQCPAIGRRQTVLVSEQQD